VLDRRKAAVDRDRFDALTRVLATTPSRRVALGALLAAAVAGVPGLTAARNKKRKQRHKKRQKTRTTRPGTEAASLSSEAVQCDPPRHSARLVGCDYSGGDLDGVVLHSSNLKNAKFTGTSLIEANLHATTLTGADFSGANLCGADLSSSALRRAVFTGANLTRADLHSSGCGGADFTGATFCNTIDCNGDVINPGCTACCLDSDCGAGQICSLGTCVAGQGTCASGDNFCANTAKTCDGRPDCQCRITSEGTTRCGGNAVTGVCGECGSTAECQALHPAIPGVFCMAGGTGCCNGTAPRGDCVRPCPS
jgi:hypothetical protein